eukprot:TRINITY_DN65567_c0_g1_i1.p1 TRINITY_DN65567_c0_g1~~TRINITY_DN65567_c0_g1_i1.p1  ORF type:complete len:380 (+),score=62.99 TRINITY_DN65567_c0_g1_i1:86-1225(+)
MTRLIVAAWFLHHLEATPGKIYWGDVGRKAIRRANLDGSLVETIVSGLQSPNGVAIDAVAGKIYWTDSGTQKIQRASLDGHEVEDILTVDTSQLGGLALDVAAGKMYWAVADITKPKVQQASLNGTDVRTLVASGLRVVEDVAVVAGHGRIYWSDSMAQRLQSANLDGSDVYTHISCGHACTPVGVLVHLPSSQLLWTDTYQDKLSRTDFAHRSLIQEPPTIDVMTGLDRPVSMALDWNTDQLYWTDAHARKIQRRALWGGTVEDVILPQDTTEPSGIAVIPETTSTVTMTSTSRTSATQTSSTATTLTRTNTQTTSSTTTSITSATQVLESVMSRRSSTTAGWMPDAAQDGMTDRPFVSDTVLPWSLVALPWVFAAIL